MSAQPKNSETTRTSLATILTERIRTDGPVTFEEFMRQCLYHPEHGYYSRPNMHPLRDYYTSVDVHPIFGRLIARQLEEMWRILEKPNSFTVVEAGASVGMLASHILDFIRNTFPAFYLSLQYVTVEQSAWRRKEQESRLESHLRAQRVTLNAKMPTSIPAGCIFSNELIDALPTHRISVREGELVESYIEIEGHAFVERFCSPSTAWLTEYFQQQGITLREKSIAEACLDACDWIECAGRSLARGFVMTIDYGHEASELYNEGHNRGTLLAYQNHIFNENILSIPGEQDLTSHVNFSALDIYGSKAGLRRSGLMTQSQFLVALGRTNEFDDLYEPGQTELDKLRARLQLKNLIHPEGLGEKFQVLIQQKNVDDAKLTGVSGY